MRRSGEISKSSGVTTTMVSGSKVAVGSKETSQPSMNHSVFGSPNGSGGGIESVVPSLNSSPQTFTRSNTGTSPTTEPSAASTKPALDATIQPSAPAESTPNNNSGSMSPQPSGATNGATLMSPEKPISSFAAPSPSVPDTARTLSFERASMVEPPEELLRNVDFTLEHYRVLSEAEKLQVLALLDRLDVGEKMGRFYDSSANADKLAEESRLLDAKSRAKRAEGAEFWAQDTLKSRSELREILSRIKCKDKDEPNRD